MDPKHIAWSRGIFDGLRPDGGVWAVPRSGLIFTRRGESLILTARLPWSSSMSIPQADLEALQSGDYDAIALHMLAAGVPVSDSTGLRPAS